MHCSKYVKLETAVSYCTRINKEFFLFVSTIDPVKVCAFFLVFMQLASMSKLDHNT